MQMSIFLTMATERALAFMHRTSWLKLWPKKNRQKICAQREWHRAKERKIKRVKCMHCISKIMLKSIVYIAQANAFSHTQKQEMQKRAYKVERNRNEQRSMHLIGLGFERYIYYERGEQFAINLNNKWIVSTLKHTHSATSLTCFDTVEKGKKQQNFVHFRG